MSNTAYFDLAIAAEESRHCRKRRFGPHGHISATARKLGCSFPHLWMVRHGHRTSHKLMARYQALQTKEAAL
jgi:hypothetical protein